MRTIHKTILNPALYTPRITVDLPMGAKTGRIVHCKTYVVTQVQK